MTENPYETPIDSSGTPPPTKRVRFRLVELLVVVAIVGLLTALLLPATRRARPAARRMQCSNNLKQIALALRNYESEYQSFPPAYTVDSEGRPLHSWRTLILPYVEQKPLYDSIDFSRPWDDPANAEAYAASPFVFSCSATDASPSFTTYMVVVAANGCFPPTNARQFAEITDDPSDTLMVIEVSPDQAVHWMAPRDADARFVLSFSEETEFAHSNGINAAFADGSVRFLSADMSGANRRAIISIAGDDSVAD